MRPLMFTILISPFEAQQTDVSCYISIEILFT